MTLLFNSKDTRMQCIISKCASLHETYKPPWWCFGPWINVFITLIKEKLAPSLRLQREIIVCEDGGRQCLFHYRCTTQNEILENNFKLLTNQQFRKFYRRSKP